MNTIVVGGCRVPRNDSRATLRFARNDGVGEGDCGLVSTALELTGWDADETDAGQHGLERIF